MNNKTTKMAVPGAKQAIDRMKYEIVNTKFVSYFIFHSVNWS